MEKTAIKKNTKVASKIKVPKAAAKKEFLLLGDYSYGDSDLAVYVRPTFKVSGDSGGWITNDGIVLTIPQKIFIHSSEIILSGAINPWVSKNIRVKASILNLNKTSTEIKSKLTMNTKNYTILIIPPKYAINNGNPVKIKILFTSYFVPQKIGLNQDTRKLIFTTPTVKIIKIH